jgi:hypothetical protein
MASLDYEVEASYGWCGLCHTFSQFPHDCPERDFSAEERDFGLNESSSDGVAERP